MRTAFGGRQLQSPRYCLGNIVRLLRARLGSKSVRGCRGRRVEYKEVESAILSIPSTISMLSHIERSNIIKADWLFTLESRVIRSHSGALGMSSTRSQDIAR